MSFGPDPLSTGTNTGFVPRGGVRIEVGQEDKENKGMGKHEDVQTPAAPSLC